MIIKYIIIIIDNTMSLSMNYDNIGIIFQLLLLIV